MIRPKEDPRKSGYTASRAAMRDFFGSRRIDANAAPSAADTTPSANLSREQGITDFTPSGQVRQLVESGVAPDQARKAADLSWRDRFKTGAQVPDKPATAQDAITAAVDSTRALARFRTGQMNAQPPINLAQPTPTPASPLEAIQQSRQNGAAMGVFATPYGDVGYGKGSAAQVFSDAPTLMPQQPVAAVDEYLGRVAGAATPSLFPSITPPKKPSILDDTQKWLTTV